MKKIRLKNYIVIVLGTILGLLLLTLLDYTGNALKAPQLKLIIQDEFQEVSPGETIKADLVVYNTERTEKLLIIYELKKLGSEDSIIKEGTLNIEQDSAFPIEFILPKTSPSGIYQLTASIKGEDYSVSEIFQVKQASKASRQRLLNASLYILSVLILLTLVLFIKRHWDWVKNFKINLKLLTFDIKWQARRKNFFLSYLYIIIIALILVIILLFILLK